VTLIEFLLYVGTVPVTFGDRACPYGMTISSSFEAPRLSPQLLRDRTRTKYRPGGAEAANLVAGLVVSIARRSANPRADPARMT
jgi:hypothetical protein